jgi:hypothetical protein
MSASRSKGRQKGLRVARVGHRTRVEHGLPFLVNASYPGPVGEMAHAGLIDRRLTLYPAPRNVP